MILDEGEVDCTHRMKIMHKDTQEDEDEDTFDGNVKLERKPQKLKLNLLIQQERHVE